MSEATADAEVLKSKTEEKDDNFRLKASLFLGGVCGMSAMIGFSSTVMSSKNNDPEFFNKGLLPQGGSGKVIALEAGPALAMRALGWGTLYAVGGCGILFYGIWKMIGANDLKEFRMKMGNVLPRIPKNDPPQGRTEFENLTDFLRYVSEEGSKKSS